MPRSRRLAAGSGSRWIGHGRRLRSPRCRPVPFGVEGFEDPSAEALLELEEDPDPGEVDAAVPGQMADPGDPPDVVLAVEADVGGGPGRTEQALVLVDPEGPRMRADERRRHADDVDGRSDRGRRRIRVRPSWVGRWSCRDARTLTMPLSRVLTFRFGECLARAHREDVAERPQAARASSASWLSVTARPPTNAASASGTPKSAAPRPARARPDPTDVIRNRSCSSWSRLRTQRQQRARPRWSRARTRPARAPPRRAAARRGPMADSRIAASATPTMSWMRSSRAGPPRSAGRSSAAG